MTPGTKRLAIDIGGSHISASIINLENSENRQVKIHRQEINSTTPASEILEHIAKNISAFFLTEPDINGIGIAFPGPFNYAKGISLLKDVGGKFESTFGLDVQQALKDITGLQKQSFAFSNDAHCFALGAYKRLGLQSNRTLFITLGTGFGSAFMKDGVLVLNSKDIPENGTFYNQPFLSGSAEEYISSRWILKEYTRQTGETFSAVKDIAGLHSDTSRHIFAQYGSNLGKFLLPWLVKFGCEELVIGGNITKAKDQFIHAFEEQVDAVIPIINVIYCDNTEECILTGAALQVNDSVNQQTNDELILANRKSSQALLPVSITKPERASYNIFPAYLSEKPVYEGFDTLAELICKEQLVIIDGYGGVLWDHFIPCLREALRSKNKRIFWYDFNSCLNTPDKIDHLIEKNLNGDDPVFGKKFTGDLVDFFDAEKIDKLKPDSSADLCIVYGTGAALSKWEGFLVYADVPKNEIQYRMRAGSITNLGASGRCTNSQTYKRFYFVDWPVLNQHKDRLLPGINCIVDEQRITSITWMQGDDFRNTLNDMLGHAIRARPWFEAGIWGGDWMKEKIKGLNTEEPNYAWSFELITPENGIVITGNNRLLEISFDFLLFSNNIKLLGKAANRFHKQFPIRFDFLDTYDGGNLSVQCHPRTDYIRDNFGESFTQDETYYILDCKPGATVYLGFQEDIDPDLFKLSLLDAQKNGVEMEVEKFVQQHQAHKHDLFLIPNGTIHASGKNNMVLEISNTPYIFTFKMYDWLRVDANGQPRPINIEHAFHNLYFDRKGDYVQKQLISHPIVEIEWENGRKLKLPTHREHFYTIDRYEFTGELSISTNGQCHCCMLVEGDSIEVITGDRKNIFCYAETFVIPASVEKYVVRFTQKGKAFLVVSYVKEDQC